MTRAARLLRLCLVALAVPSLAAARGGTPSGAPGVSGDEALRLPSLVVDAEARAIITVQVPVPDALRDLEEVTYVVRLLNGATIVGPTAGVMAVRRTASRALLLTLRVPHDVRAGELDVADVEFRGGGRAPVVQPVRVRIPLRRQVTASGAREVNQLSAGDRVDLVYRLVNEGNAPEALNVALRLPSGWQAKPAVPRVIVIPRGEAVEVATTVTIPGNTGIGDHTAVLEAGTSWPPSAAPVAQFRTVLRVTVNATTMSGLMLTPIVATATGSDGSATFVGATLDGPLSESVRLRARLLPRVRTAGIVSQGLSAVGAFQGPFAASIAGKDWEVAAGNALVQLSDLTGVNVIGEGLTASGQRGEWEGRAVAGRPSGGQGVAGELIGAGLWRDGDFGRVGGSASYLAERGGVARGRDLTALAAEYETRPIGAFTLGAGLAYRESYGAVGAGYSMRAAHERPSDRVALSITHAPGGSGAFARATDELQLAVGRDLSARWSIDGAVARSHDRSNVFRAMNVHSWNAGQRFAFTPRSSATLRAQSNVFDARSATGAFGSFGSGTRDLTAGYEWRRGLLALSAEGAVGAVTRRTELLGGRSVETVAAQRGGRIFASRALERLGMIDASVGVQFTQSGVGMPGDVWVGSARWAGIPITSGRRAVRLDAEAQYQRLGTLQSFLITRSSVTMTLPGGLDLAMTAERNPYYRDRNGNAGWIAAMRISAGRLLRSASNSGDEGVVYADLNGNGRRDAGEAGVPGVVLRRGDARVTSDRDGHYRLPSRVRGRTRVDQGSLPAGMLAHPLLAADTLERRDIPLLETGTVMLALRIFRDEDGRAPEVNLRDARVFLRDATGFEWVGRHADDSTLVFEDVPAGTYAPRFDFSMAAEPLRVDESLVVTVVPRERRTVTVPLRGRAVRITLPPPRGGDRGTPRTRNRTQDRTQDRTQIESAPPAVLPPPRG